MPRLIIIGGPPRCGKTTAADLFISRHAGYDTLRLDAFCMVAKHSFNVDLTDNARAPWSRPADAVEEYRKRDIESARLAIPYLRNRLKHGSDLICEGLFWPGCITLQDLGCEAHFIDVYLTRLLGRNDEYETLQRINRISEPAGGSWLAKYSDEQIMEYAKVSRRYSARFIEECAGFKRSCFTQRTIPGHEENVARAVAHIETAIESYPNS